MDEKDTIKDTITLEKATVWKFAFFIVLALFLYSTFSDGFSFGSGSGSGNGGGGSPTPTPTGAAIKISLDDDSPFLGDSDAKISVIEFSDFQCPFCARAATGTVSELKNSDLFKDGEINFVFRHFPLSSIHPYAQKSAEASECANRQGKFWEYHDALFLNQNALDTPSLKNYASQVGLDVEGFNSCLDSGDASDKVSKDLKAATDSGGRGTPYFVIYNSDNGKTASVSGAVPFAQIESAIRSIQ
jgi:protein-disulfide isomerase